MWKRILLSFVICCCVFLVTEGVLRILEHHSQKIRFYTSNAYQAQTVDLSSNLQVLLGSLIWASWPGATINGFVVNDRGFLTPNLSYDNPTHAKRLVLLGDSHGVGIVPYPQSFIRVLENRIRTENNMTFDAINLSIAGIGPRIEQEILGLEGQRYHPDVILLTFTVTNDFSDDAKEIKRFEAQTQQTYSPNYWLFRSRVISLFRNTLLILSSRYTGPGATTNGAAASGTYEGDVDYDETEDLIDTQTYLRQEAQQYMNIYLADGSSYQNIANVQHAIRIMNQIATSIHAKFFVVIMPSPMQLDPTLFQQARKYFDKPQGEFDMSLPQKKIKEILTAEQIPYLDLLDVWATEPSAIRYFRHNDDHLNIQGNKAVSDLLYPIAIQLLK